MVSIAVCDDDIRICELIEKTLETKNVDIDVFYTGEELVQKLLSGVKYHIVFLDIELNTINGVEIGLTIRKELQDYVTQIIYISSKENYAMQLFKIRPADFLVKPFSDNEVEDAFRNCYQVLEDCSIKFKNGYDVVLIRANEIRYVCSEGRKIRVVTTQTEEQFYGKIEDYRKEFETAEFVRIHKSYFINPLHLSKYTYDFAIMNDGSELNISKRYKVKVRQQLMERWRKKNDHYIGC